ncbi:CotH kinase family protein, partial [Calditrichota bacterium]
KIPEDGNYSNLYNFILAVDTSRSDRIINSLGKWLDINNYIKYHALTSLINNPDAFKNNFFIFKESVRSPFKCVPWDFDQSFRREVDVGLFGKNAIINRLFENDSTLNMYKSELINLLNTIFTVQNVDSVINKNRDIIEEAYNIDPYLGNGRYNLEAEIQSLKEYIANRRQYFLDNIDSLTPNSQ